MTRKRISWRATTCGQHQSSRTLCHFSFFLSCLGTEALNFSLNESLVKSISLWHFYCCDGEFLPTGNGPSQYCL
ncbi:hypothetical protein CVS40_5239 [Lucilia cuprina]|nr:hypothetical protein CVS40_5239 [Lucilia cuprina]